MFQLAGRIALIAFALFAAAASVARADPFETKLAVSLDVLSGDHEVNLGRRDQLHWVPLPLGELTLRHGPDALRIEGMPPLSSTYGTAGDTSANSVRLSILNATYRRDLGSGWFVGAGQTVYNQGTTGSPNDFGQTAQYSRVTGARWEIGRIARTGRDRIEAWASFNPAMHGLGHTQYAGFTVCSFPPGSIAPPSCGTSAGVTVNDGESASQIDLSARIAHALSKRGELLFGIRYLNYSARYDRAPGSIVDRSVGFAPTIGYRTRL